MQWALGGAIVILLILGTYSIAATAVIAWLLDERSARRESQRLADKARRAAGYGWLSERGETR